MIVAVWSFLIILILSPVMFFLIRSKPRLERDPVLTTYRHLDIELRRRTPSNFDAGAMLDIPMLYINLDRSTDRREYIEKTFREWGAPVPIRVPAVDGKAFVSGAELDWLTPELTSILRAAVSASSSLMTSPSAGELGCTLSHIKALKYAYDQGWSEFVIFEDDISLSLVPFWPDNLSNLARRAPLQWNFILLAPTHCKKPCTQDICSFKVDDCYCVAAYMGSDRIASTISSFFNSDGQLSERILSTTAPLFSADVFFFQRFPSANYIERLPRFIVINTELESTIHPEHTTLHLKACIDVMERYLDQKMV